MSMIPYASSWSTWAREVARGRVAHLPDVRSELLGLPARLESALEFIKVSDKGCGRERLKLPKSAHDPEAGEPAEGFHMHRYEILRHDQIIRYEYDVLTTRLTDSDVASRRDLHVLRFSKYTEVAREFRRSQQLLGLIGAPVIHDQDFILVLRDSLAAKRPKRLLQCSTPVISCDNYAS